jgi:hypothetical protein
MAIQKSRLSSPNAGRTFSWWEWIQLSDRSNVTAGAVEPTRPERAVGPEPSQALAGCAGALTAAAGHPQHAGLPAFSHISLLSRLHRDRPQPRYRLPQCMDPLGPGWAEGREPLLRACGSRKMAKTAVLGSQPPFIRKEEKRVNRVPR